MIKGQFLVATINMLKYMKPNNIYFFLLLIVFTCLIACKKESSEKERFNAYLNDDLNDTSWSNNNTLGSGFMEKIFESTAINPYLDSINAENNTTINLPGNIAIDFPKNGYQEMNGSNLTNGTIHIAAYSLSKKGDLIKFIQSTTHRGTLFENLGIFCIRAYKDNKELLLAKNSKITIRFSNNKNSAGQDIKLFTGVENPTPLLSNHHYFNFSWDEQKDGVEIKTYPNGSPGNNTSTGFEVTTNKLNWIGVGKPLENTNFSASFAVVLPLNFTNKNTMVFAVLDETNTVAQLSSNFSGRAFTIDHFPSNKKFTLLSISKIGKDFYFDSRINNVASNNAAYKLNPSKVTLSYISSILDNL